MRFNIHVLVLGSNTPLVTRTHGNRARPLRYAFAPALRVREIAFQRTIAYGRVRLRAITYGRVRLRVQFRVLPRAIYTREYTRAREAFYTGTHRTLSWYMYIALVHGVPLVSIISPSGQRTSYHTSCCEGYTLLLITCILSL